MTNSARSAIGPATEAFLTGYLKSRPEVDRACVFSAVDSGLLEIQEGAELRARLMVTNEERRGQRAQIAAVARHAQTLRKLFDDPEVSERVGGEYPWDPSATFAGLNQLIQGLPLLALAAEKAAERLQGVDGKLLPREPSAWIAGEALPALAREVLGLRGATRDAEALPGEQALSGECLEFIQAALADLGINYAPETIYAEIRRANKGQSRRRTKTGR